jgi:hypothetical protein
VPIIMSLKCVGTRTNMLEQGVNSVESNFFFKKIKLAVHVGDDWKSSQCILKYLRCIVLGSLVP